MRREWLMALLVVVLLVPVGCGTTVRASTVPGGQSVQLQSSGTSGTYTVQSGDTLMGISRKLFNGDPQYWDEIAALNGIKAPHTIYPGQELKLPNKGEVTASASVVQPQTEQKSDLLWYEQKHGPWFYEPGGTGTALTPIQSQASTASGTYKVQSGDTLMSIARKLLGDPRRWREIANLNNIGPPYTIYPGQELKVP